MMPTRFRVLTPILASASILAVLSAMTFVSQSRARIEELEGQMNRLLTERKELLTERKELQTSRWEERACYQGWLDRVTIPRETILRQAKSDTAKVIGGGSIAPSPCFATATLQADGWHVECGLDACVVPSSPKVSYLVD